MKKSVIALILLIISVSITFAVLFFPSITGMAPLFSNYNSQNLALEEQQSSTNTYYYGNSLIASKKDNSIAYYHQDYLGSNKIQTDNSGKLEFSSRQAPFGKDVYSSGSSSGSENRYKFTGQESDKDLYYYGARYYDANTGRFTQIDPVLDSASPYRYSDNNPLKYIDQTGAKIELPVGGQRNAILNTFNNLVGDGVLSAVENAGKFFLQGPSSSEYKGEYPNTYELLYELIEDPETIQIFLTDLNNPPRINIFYYNKNCELICNFPYRFEGSPGQFIEPEYFKSDVTYKGESVDIGAKSFSGFSEVHFSVGKHFGFNYFDPHEVILEEARSEITLFHELGHAYYYINGKSEYGDVIGVLGGELSLGPGVYFENIARREHGLSERLLYLPTLGDVLDYGFLPPSNLDLMK